MADGDEGTRGDLAFGTTWGALRSAVERFGDAEAVVDTRADGETRLSWRELGDAATTAARAFLALGVEIGDRVSIWAPNRHEWIVAALGLQACGAVLVPLNTRFKGNEAGYVLGKSGARLLCTVSSFLDTDYLALLRAAGGGSGGGRAVAELAALEQVILLDVGAGRDGVMPADATGVVSWDEFLSCAAGASDDDVAARTAQVTSEHLADLLFTSGTTGNPKGVMCTHGQTLRSFRDWSDVVGLREGDRYLVVNPFFHAFGYKAGWLSALMMGATIVPHAVFDVPTVMARVVEERISMLPGPPTLFQSILAHPELATFDMSTLRLAVTGAAAIPVSLITEMRERLGFETIITGYGLTESCGIATMCRHDDDPTTIATTSGRAIPAVEVWCVDEAGAEVERGAPGEVVVRGYNVMQGYFDEPDETAATIDDDGWLHTGDIGVMDERGYLRITDRVKDMFIMGGFNAYPAEIENLLAPHPAIAQVAVVGVPDERMGEVGMAFVVRRPGAELDAATLIAWAREQMANYKVPRHVEFVDELPLNATGKVLKFQLRDRGRQIVEASG